MSRTPGLFAQFRDKAAAAQDKAGEWSMPLAGNPTYRLLHVSDLHIGDLPVTRVPMALNAPTSRWLRNFPVLEGQLGHHARALEGLHEFHEDLVKDNIPFDLVVSGDLTANGAVAQFGLADAYLGAGPTPFGYFLDRPDWVELSVTGNHDNWPGINSIIGPRTTGPSTYLPGPWPKEVVRQLTGGRWIRYILLDTDAEVAAVGHNRLMGRGAFTQQLIQLENLPRIEQGEIRVIVMHHSILGPETAGPHPLAPAPFRHAPVPNGRIRRLEIDHPSARLIRQFIVDHSISVVLTGHMHEPQLSLLATTNGRHIGRFLEARCGTTTQRDRYPYKDARNMRAIRTLPPNTLIMHEIVEENGQHLWTAQLYWLDRQGRFVTQVPHIPGVPQGYAWSSISLP
ncbi:metallophosphoesterase family protein [Methylobacterium sp. J-067]|uniref:metallophosphoesterase family protein n=1 Tax=Methylobacterium sp. J-067 TaxID=2836648 RepID=UPI001FBBDDC1|nr:metallophosphoesterase [Methylobacterium sp. J-067]MCJ2026466.1 metallophosphoesterase [Methylobacterium sp. J-067]